MRIGFITGEYPPMQGGVGDYTNRLSQTLSSQGHSVYILSEKRARQQHEAIPVSFVPDSWGFSGIRKITRWSETEQLDVLSLQFQTAAYSMSPWIHFVPDLLTTPIVTTFHDLRFPYLFPKAGWLRNWIVRHLAKASDAVVVTNREDYLRVQDLKRVEVIPIGSAISSALPANFDRAAWRKRLSDQSDSFVIGYFGFINHSKGVDTLLKALSRLEDPEAKLVMIGDRIGTADSTNIAYADQIDLLIKDLNIQNRIIWTGYVSDEQVMAYLATVDVVVLPFRDGASYRRSSLMAAIECACAIITTRPSFPTPGFSEESMLLIPPNDVEALVRAIQTLYTTPSLAQRLKEGAAQLKYLFNWDAIARDNAALFQQVIRKQTD